MQNSDINVCLNSQVSVCIMSLQSLYHATWNILDLLSSLKGFSLNSDKVQIRQKKLMNRCFFQSKESHEVKEGVSFVSMVMSMLAFYCLICFRGWLLSVEMLR